MTDTGPVASEKVCTYLQTYFLSPTLDTGFSRAESSSAVATARYLSVHTKEYDARESATLTTVQSSEEAFDLLLCGSYFVIRTLFQPYKYLSSTSITGGDGYVASFIPTISQETLFSMERPEGAVGNIVVFSTSSAVPKQYLSARIEHNAFGFESLPSIHNHLRLVPVPDSQQQDWLRQNLASLPSGIEPGAVTDTEISGPAR